jgi:hypothetical protein
VVETYASTPDELTIRQPDGPGFFHVSLGEDGVTLGCSTAGEALPCFYAVRDAAVTDKRLLDNLAGDAHLTVHLRSSANEEPIRELPAGRHGIGSWLEGVFSDMPEFVAARLDVGDWSWQWDNLGTPEWPWRRAFGGLTDVGNFYALSAVIERVGDEWVRGDFQDLLGQATAFLQQQQRY